MLTFGNVLCGIGMAAAGFGPIFGSISRQTPPQKRSIALGVATAGGSFGQFAIVPFASLLQYRLDNWHTTMFILSVMSMVMVPLAFGLREHRAQAPKFGTANPQGAKDALQEAFQTLRLLATDHWVLRVRFSRDIYRIASPLVHFRQGGRHVVLWHADFGPRARRLGHRPCRPVQHRRLFDLGLAREPISEKGHAGVALRACARWHS